MRWLGRAISEDVARSFAGELDRIRLDVVLSFDGDSGELEGLTPLDDVAQRGWGCVRDTFAGDRLRPDKPGTLTSVVVLEL